MRRTGLAAGSRRILDLWLVRVRDSIRSAKSERIPILIDTLPVFLEQLAQALSPKHPRADATQSSTVPRSTAANGRESPSTAPMT